MTRRRISKADLAKDRPLPERPQPPLGTLPKSHHTTRWSPEETTNQMLDVEQLLLQSRSQREIFVYMRGKHRVGNARVMRLVARVYDEWAEQDADKRSKWRSRLIRNVERWIREADGRQKGGVWIEKPDHAARARYAQILVDVQGLRAPLEVNVNVQVSEAMTAVIADLSSEDVQREIDAAREDRELAERARRLLPALSPAVTVDSAAE